MLQFDHSLDRERIVSLVSRCLIVVVHQSRQRSPDCRFLVALGRLATRGPPLHDARHAAAGLPGEPDCLARCSPRRQQSFPSADKVTSTGFSASLRPYPFCAGHSDPPGHMRGKQALLGRKWLQPFRSDIFRGVDRTLQFCPLTAHRKPSVFQTMRHQTKASKKCDSRHGFSTEHVSRDGVRKSVTMHEPHQVVGSNTLFRNQMSNAQFWEDAKPEVGFNR